MGDETLKSLKIAAALVAGSLMIVPSFAADVAVPLPAGKPAGTNDAAILSVYPLFFAGVAAVLVGSIVLFNNVTGSQKPVTTSTGTSSWPKRGYGPCVRREFPPDASVRLHRAAGRTGNHRLALVIARRLEDEAVRQADQAAHGA